MSASTISPTDLSQLHQTGKSLELIDVRTPVEFRECHVTFARNLPLDRLDPAAVMQARGEAAKEPLYVICRSGGRGQQACERFRQAGFANVVNVTGGTQACLDSGLPIVRGKKAISLERQVRIAAGSLVVLGSALGWLVHPAFIGLAAFVAQAWSLPASPTPAAWVCCWPACRGISVRKPQRAPIANLPKT